MSFHAISSALAICASATVLRVSSNVVSLTKDDLAVEEESDGLVAKLDCLEELDLEEPCEEERGESDGKLPVNAVGEVSTRIVDGGWFVC